MWISLYFFVLFIPQILIYLIPITAFLAVFIVMNRFSENSEAVVLSASGAGPNFYIKPVFLASSIIVILSYVLTLYINPQSYRAFRELKTTIREGFAGALIQEGSFVRPSSGLTIYIHHKLKDKRYSGIMIHDERKKNETSTLFAEKGKLVLRGDKGYLALSNGNRLFLNEKGQTHFAKFNAYETEIDFVNKDFLDSTTKKLKGIANEATISELFYPDKEIKENPKLLKKYYLQAHERLLLPLYIVSFMIYTVFYITTSPYRRNRKITHAIPLFLSLGSIEILYFFSKNSALKHSFFLSFFYLGFLIPLIMAAWRYHSFRQMKGGH